MERIIFSITKLTEDGVASIDTYLKNEDDVKALTAGLASFLYQNEELMARIIAINALRETKPEIFDRHEVRADDLPWINILNER